MSLRSIGADAKYILPASYDSVPQAWMSNKAPKPVNCSLQTVNIPALTGNANAGGTTIIQVPCGPNAGYMSQPYLRFSVTFSGAAAAAATNAKFKGSTASCSAILNRYSSYIGSMQIDNIQNADQVYDELFAHCSSSAFMERDATILMGSGTTKDVLAAATWNSERVFVLPLLGLLGSQSALPLFALNGTLQIQLDYNSFARAIYTTTDTSATVNGFIVSSVQLVYDKISVEQSFVDRIKADMAMGNKFVYGYTNYQSTTLVPTASATTTLNYGLNVSSLRAIVSNQLATADLGTALNQGLSVVNALSLFQVSLDGRLLNNNTLNASTSEALVFAELNKCFSRLFDATSTDLGLKTSESASTFSTNYFMVGVSAQRINEALAFSGSPVSVVGLQVTVGATACTMFCTFISDYQLLIDASGSVEIVR